MMFFSICNEKKFFYVFNNKTLMIFMKLLTQKQVIHLIQKLPNSYSINCHILAIKILIGRKILKYF